MESFTSLLLGEKNNYNFSKMLIGSHRLKDSDADSVPDIFDCKPNNPKKQGSLHDTYRTPKGVKTAEQYRESIREKKYGKAPDVQLTPENIQAIEKSGGVQAGTPLAQALEGKSVQIVQAPKSTLTPQSIGYNPNVYYNIKPAPITQATPIPQVVQPDKLSPILVPKPTSLTYAQAVKEAYNQKISEQKIKYNWDLVNAGNYKQGDIYISKVFPFKSSTISHEIGHKLDFTERVVRDYSEYKESSKNLIPDFLENIGYNKKTSPVEYEYYARAFANYIKNPENFRKKYPEVAREFDNKLNVSYTEPAPEKSIGVWKPDYEEQYYKKPKIEVIKELREYPFVNPISAFKSSGRRVSEVKETQVSPVIKIGSISQTEAPTYTYGELQKEIDVNRLVGISKSDYYTKSEQFFGIQGTKEQEAKESITKTLETASLINPATASLMGAYKFSKLPTTDEYTYYNPKTGVTETVKPIVKPTFEEKVEASSFLVFGGLGALSKTRKIEKDIVKLELEQAGKQPIKFSEIQVIGKEGKGTRVIMKGESEFRNLKTEVEVAGTVYPTGKSGKAFIMPTGTGEARISGETSWTLFGGGKPTKLVGVQEFEVGAKGISFDLGKGKLVGVPKKISEEVTARQVVKGKAFGTIGTGTAIPTKSTSIIFSEKQVSPYLTFPSSKIRYVSGRQARKTGKKLASELIKGYETGGTISKELTTAQSMKLEKDLYLTATKKGDIGVSKIIYPKEETGVSIFRGETKTPIKTFGEDTITVYHTTAEKNVPSILKEGLIPSKTSGIHGVIGESENVFTAISKQTAEGYKVMRGEGATILEIQVPKEKFFEAVREKGVGTIGQVQFKYVPSQWIKAQKEIGVSKESLLGVSKVIEKPVSKVTEKLTIGITERIPSISPSKYAGLGMYERYQPSENLEIIKPTKVEGRIKDLGVSETRFGSSFAPISITETRTKEREKEEFKSSSSLLTGLSFVEPSAQEQPSILRQPQRQKQPTKTKQREPNIFIPTTPRTPNIRYPEEVVPPFEFGWFIFPPKKKKSSKKYIAELRRRGKFTQVSKPTSLSEAIGIGVEKVKSTLGASFRIKSEEGKVMPLSLSSPEFRPSKRETGVQIQRRKFRLSAFEEVKEIQQSRKRFRL